MSPMPGGRRCDRDARRLIGWPRNGAIVSAPARSVLRDLAAGVDVSLSAVSRRLISRFAEVDENIQPYWQRTVFEVHPELSFFQLNEDQPLRYSKHRQAGVEERTALLKARLPGVERILDTHVRGAKPAHQVDAAVCLWTARRIAARAVSRLPEDPGMGQRRAADGDRALSFSRMLERSTENSRGLDCVPLKR